MERIRPFATIAFLAAALVACGGGTTTTAQISITNVWARPMVVETGATPAMPTSGAAASAVGMMGTTAAGSVMPGGMVDTGAGGVTDALYLTITNKGGTADRLTGARADIAQATELHQTVIQNGVAQMQPVQGIDIPVHGTVTFKPGGYHVMLIGLAHTLKAGDTFPVTLTFARSGAIAIMATVRDQ
jgi:hypothetical protein